MKKHVELRGLVPHGGLSRDGQSWRLGERFGAILGGVTQV